MRPIASIIIDAALVTATSAFAAWLSEHKKLEPDWTWVEVGSGVALCLAAAYLQSHRAGGDWQSGQREVWHAFGIGAPPIIIGEMHQWLKKEEQRRRYQALRQ